MTIFNTRASRIKAHNVKKYGETRADHAAHADAVLDYVKGVEAAVKSGDSVALLDLVAGISITRFQVNLAHYRSYLQNLRHVAGHGRAKVDAEDAEVAAKAKAEADAREAERLAREARRAKARENAALRAEFPEEGL